jgi:hypothetical protein
MGMSRASFAEIFRLMHDVQQDDGDDDDDDDDDYE